MHPFSSAQPDRAVMQCQAPLKELSQHGACFNLEVVIHAESYIFHSTLIFLFIILTYFQWTTFGSEK